MKALLVIVMTLLPSLPAAGQDAKSVQRFDEGTAALIDGRFNDALRAFESIEMEGWGSDGLYYNMALAHYRLDNLGQAIRYLERAQLLNEDDPRIQHSLSIARQRQPDRFSTLPDPFWLTAQRWLVDALPIRAAFIIGLLCWFGFVATWLARTVAEIEGEWLRRGRTAALAAGVILMLHALGSSVWPPHPDRSVVLSDTLTLREQASPEAAGVVDVHEGLVVEIRADAPDWRLVEIPNGTRGWVPSSTLGDI